MFAAYVFAAAAVQQQALQWSLVGCVLRRVALLALCNRLIYVINSNIWLQRTGKQIRVS